MRKVVNHGLSAPRRATAGRIRATEGEPLLTLSRPLVEGRPIRWFKHISKSSDDPILSDIEAKFGITGYARFFKMIEAIAESMKKDSPPSLSLSVNRWCEILRAKKKILRTFLEHCQNVSRIKQELNGNILTITYPNILKYKDEYQQKSRHCPDTLPPQIQSREGEGEKVLTPLSSMPKKQASQTCPPLSETLPEKAKKFIHPTEAELIAYMTEKQFIDPCKSASLFLNHYESNGWRVGNNPMRSWKAAAGGIWKSNQSIGGFGGNGNGREKITGSDRTTANMLAARKAIKMGEERERRRNGEATGTSGGYEGDV